MDDVSLELTSDMLDCFFFFPGIPMTAIAHENKTLTKIGECY